MGNSLGSKKTTKVMKIDGETMKLKTPVKAEEVTKDFPGHVLLDSESVRHYGVRAKPLRPHQNLEPKRLYFLVEPPREFPTRRVKSEIRMNAQEKLEHLMLARRSASDLSVMKPAGNWEEEEIVDGGSAVRVTIRVRKAEIEKAVKESENESEARKKIVSLCMAESVNLPGGRPAGALAVGNSRNRVEVTRARDVLNRTLASFGSEFAFAKHVSFMAPKETGSEITVAS